MKHLAILLLTSLIPVFANSVELVSNAKIYEVGNTSNGGEDFYIRVQGGDGPCAQSLIKFPLSKAASVEAHKRAFSLALAAMSTGSNKVKVSNFESSESCALASYIAFGM